MVRYGTWIGAPEVSAPRLVRERESIDLALANGAWIGIAVFIYSFGAWTVIEELSGRPSAPSAERWLALADDGDLVYAAYNDAVAYAELVVIEHGRLVRHYSDDEQDPATDADVGQLPEEDKQRFESWTDVAAWIDDDTEKIQRPDWGWLWIHRAT